ncbi:MAG TPA: hypothetical protein ENI73_06465, partial [Spirochaetes bacterium]|nr:hypothetical protein [Spirochaetota bacterium]
MYPIRTIFILVFCSTLLYGANQRRVTLIITVKNARIQKKASAFTRQLGRLAFGSYITIEGTEGYWVKLSFKIRKKNGALKKIKGYIHGQSLINEEAFKRQAESIKMRKNREFKAGKVVKPFNEEDEIAA